ncbi:hydantoinase B/oxoprolinase family protein [Edaphobacter bradus]|uniref:hydantoinase B/oxoprolinase family protein n=1 Tax=Edaphobacter bradus TaxID=2259016 RepID=UPI0021E0AC8F|nr:hydantoinase B/oxoprolinase family protein [Edaphobacter bradus]
MIRLGVDTGGTFTDLVRLDARGLTVHKVRSTPDDPARAILSGIGELMGSDPVSEVIHGSTVATNALLERKGARVALVTTKGFEDVLAIGRQTRNELYNFQVLGKRPMIGPGLTFDLAERLDCHGNVLEALQTQELEDLTEKLHQAKVDCVAVCLLHSYANPLHEQQVARHLEQAGFAVSASHSVLPEYREYERWSTTVVNAYVTPTMSRYLTTLEKGLAGTRLHIMQSNGGSISAAQARSSAVRTILSGPAAGAIGAQAIARASGFDRVILFDMGGTSTDVSLIDGQLGTTNESTIGDFPVRLPMLDIHSVGAGGGSIAYVDSGGSLRVGPRSAGADPGPVCYGKGDELTVTDANLLLGRLDPMYFLGGRMPLDVERTSERARVFADKLQLTPTRLAEGIVQIANANMERAIRAVSVQRGYDPREFALLAFGGAGGMHACEIADTLAIGTVIVPEHGGVLSALGMLLADVRRDYSQTVLRPSNVISFSDLQQYLAPLVQQAQADLAGEGFGPPNIVIECSLDIRYQGQSYEINVPLTPAFNAEFSRQHERLYGYSNTSRITEVVNVRVNAAGITQKHTFPSPQAVPKPLPPPVSTRSAWFAGRPWETAIYHRKTLLPGMEGQGPAIVTSGESTVVITPHYRFRIDGVGTLVATRIVAAGKDQLAEMSAAERSEPSQKTLDPIEFEIFKNIFLSIAEEMGITLCRTGFSPNIKERLDYSCAIYDEHGQTIAQGDHMPVHLGAMPLSVQAAIQHVSMEPGDVVILNDPFQGGTHLPDITLVQPIFLEGEPAPAFYVANRAHHSDVGGISAGSMPLAQEVFQEGLILPPIKLVRRGEICQDVMALILANVRTPAEREGDLSAQIASNRVAETRLRGLVARYGLERVRRYARATQDYAERILRHTISAIPDGEYSFEDVMDDDGFSRQRIGIRATVRIKGDEAEVDFTGTDLQTNGGINANFAITLSATLYCFRCLVQQDVLYNSGISRPIRVIAPRGMIVNAEHPAAVAGGNVETSQRITDVVLGALAQALPHIIPAASQGTMNNVTLGGRRPDDDSPFAYYETIGGGMGGRNGLSGLSGVHTHMSNTRNTPIEAIEHYLPVRIRRYSLRQGSGGAGRYPGGEGILREYEMLTETSITLLSERRTSHPYGAQGGESGGCGRNTVLHAGGSVETLPAKVRLELKPGDHLRIETPGGGGFGAANADKVAR